MYTKYPCDLQDGEVLPMRHRPAQCYASSWKQSSCQTSVPSSSQMGYYEPPGVCDLSFIGFKMFHWQDTSKPNSFQGPQHLSGIQKFKLRFQQEMHAVASQEIEESVNYFSYCFNRAFNPPPTRSSVIVRCWVCVCGGGGLFLFRNSSLE